MSKYLGIQHRPLCLEESMTNLITYIPRYSKITRNHNMLTTTHNDYIYSKYLINLALKVLANFPNQTILPITYHNPIVFQENYITKALFQPIVDNLSLEWGYVRENSSERKNSKEISLISITKGINFLISKDTELDSDKIEEYVVFIENETEYLLEIIKYLKNKKEPTTIFNIPKVRRVERVKIQQTLKKLDRYEDIPEDLYITSSVFQEILGDVDSRDCRDSNRTRMEQAKFEYFWV